MSEISELFSRDPLALTREDRTEIIKRFRADRERFMMGQKAEKIKPAAKAVPLGGLNLGDLGL